jgi:hypothetical protein
MSISFRQSFHWAWTKFKDNPIFYIGIVLTFFASWVILELIVVAGQKLGVIFNLVAHITFLIVFSGMQLGFTKICLAIYADENPSYMELFKSIHQGAKFLIAQLVYMVMFLLGLLFLLIPGFYLAGKFAFFRFDMAERDSVILDSFRTSATLINGSTGKMGFYIFLLLLLNIFGALFMGLGLLITVPVSALTMTSLYQGWKATK